MNTVTYSIPNISCSHCAHTITMELSEILGVTKVDVDVQSQLVTITFEEPASEQVLKNALSAINYPVVE